MNIPTNLRHKPVVTVEHYDRIDGKTANHTDAKGLSLGLAQWNDRGDVDISAKIWRHSGERWSRQSEEMPLHRVLDLAIMIVKTCAYFKEAYRIEGYYDSAHPVISQIELQGASAPVEICTGNDMIDKDIELFMDVLGRDSERLGERFRVLADALDDMGY